MKAPELVEVDDTRLEEVLSRVERSLDEEDAALVRAVFRSCAYVADLVEDRNASIRRLRQLFFGARTEKTDALVGRETQAPGVASPRGAVAETGPAAGDVDSDGSGTGAAPGVTGATTPLRGSAISRPRRACDFTRNRAGERCKNCTIGSGARWMTS
jgi:hypothetical protein